MIIGITGKTGSGKSTVANYVRELKYQVIDIDSIHKQVRNERLDDIIPFYKIHGYNTEDMGEMISIFFNDISLRQDINNILFPETVQRVKEMITSDGIYFMDAPLLFEMQLDKLCDKIWYVYCSKEVNVERIMKRNNLNYQKALIRYNTIDFNNINTNVFELMVNTECKYKSLIKERILSYEESYICR